MVECRNPLTQAISQLTTPAPLSLLDELLQTRRMTISDLIGATDVCVLSKCYCLCGLLTRLCRPRVTSKTLHSRSMTIAALINSTSVCALLERF